MFGNNVTVEIIFRGVSKFLCAMFSSGMLDLDHEEKALVSESADISLKRQLQYRRRHVANLTVE